MDVRARPVHKKKKKNKQGKSTVAFLGKSRQSCSQASPRQTSTGDGGSASRGQLLAPRRPPRACPARATTTLPFEILRASRSVIRRATTSPRGPVPPQGGRDAPLSSLFGSHSGWSDERCEGAQGKKRESERMINALSAKCKL